MLIETLRPYLIAFAEIFVAINIIGEITAFLYLTEKYSHKQRKKIIQDSILYALALTIIFILFSNFIFRIIAVTTSDLKITAGILLFLFSIRLLFSKQVLFFHTRKHSSDYLGMFPIATPLIASPALFIISLIILNGFSILVVTVTLILNMFLAWFLLEKSETINKFAGERGIKSFSKIFEIILAAMSIMILRQGIIEVFFK